MVTNKIFTSLFFSAMISIGTIVAQDGLIIQENSVGVCTMDGVIETSAENYTDTGYVNVDNGIGVGMSWTFTVPSTGTYQFYCRYALGGSDQTSRDAEIILNNVSTSTNLLFPYISSTWSDWSSTDTIGIALEEGTNTIRLAAVTEKGLANIDYFHIMGSDGIEPAQCLPSYTLSVGSSNTEWGTVSYEPVQELYNLGTGITVYATSNEGYFFHSWSGEESSISDTFTFNISENTDLTALFYPNGTTLEEDASGYATVQHDNGTPYLLIGGALGDTVRVDNLGDLKTHLTSSEPKIVVLTSHITSTSDDEIRIASDKTLLGEGEAHIEGIMVSIQDARNIIIRDMTFSKVVQFDEMEINANSKNIWIDHCEFFTDLDHDVDYYDGLLDIKNQSKYITVSWSKFHDHQKCILISSGDSQVGDTVIRVSFHHNYFYDAGSRLPSIRFGKAHIFNNYYKNISTGVNTRMEACVRVEKNYFEDAGTGVGMLYSPTPGAVELIDNIFENTSYSDSPTCGLDVPYEYEDLLVEPSELPDLIPANAGPRTGSSHTALKPYGKGNVLYDISAFPNPAHDKLKFSIGTSESCSAVITITDLLGKETIVYRSDNINAGQTEIDIDISDFSPGVYIYKLKTANHVISRLLYLW